MAYLTKPARIAVVGSYLYREGMMAQTLPYLSTPGSIKTCLERVKAAATPDRVTRDFVSTVLQIKGGTGSAIIPYLKKIGLVAADGSPTDLYKQYRNHTTSGLAIAKAVKHGYKDLANANEYFYRLNDKDLQALIIQVTGAGENDSVAKQTFMTLKALKTFATFEADGQMSEKPADPPDIGPANDLPIKGSGGSGSARGLNLSYTININLPATADQAVFNAIFRSLKEHLISDNE